MRTGNFRFRKGWFGRMILEIEIRYPIDMHCTTFKREWILGGVSDAAFIERALNGTVVRSVR